MSCAYGNSYIIQGGDTLFIIAERKLGNGKRWIEIKSPDGTLPNPNQLQPGQELCLPGASSSEVGSFASIVSRETYAAMFPNRNSLYSYDILVTASRKYPSFCNEGSDVQCKREAAALLANISHETGGGVFVDEQGSGAKDLYCEPSSIYPCVKGKSYHGRGPLQLSWNYNYGQCGIAIGEDLLSHPELVSSDSTITFMTALWFWMTLQPPKSSCHDAIVKSGFGMTINIINGGLECGPNPQNSTAAQHRIQLYQQYAEMLSVTPGNNLYC